MPVNHRVDPFKPILLSDELVEAIVQAEEQQRLQEEIELAEWMERNRRRRAGE